MSRIVHPKFTLVLVAAICSQLDNQRKRLLTYLRQEVSQKLGNRDLLIRLLLSQGESFFQSLRNRDVIFLDDSISKEIAPRSLRKAFLCCKAGKEA